jgi:tetratricopeptide (TPR) repeat protein/DNA-binding winged helix-turn-helix (wHTH) protein
LEPVSRGSFCYAGFNQKIFGGTSLSTASPGTTYFFGNCELDIDRREFRCAGQERPLRYQSFQLLHYLLDRPGLLISKDELTSVIWSDIAVTDNALVQCIAEIRRGLDDDPRNPRFIKTFPKIGYRFIMPVEVVHAAQGIVLDAPTELVAVNEQTHVVVAMPLVEIPAATVLQFSRSTPWTLARLTWTAIFALILLSLCGDKTQATTSKRARVFSTAGPRRLALFPLANGTGRADLSWLCEGVPNMILADIARAEKPYSSGRNSIQAVLDDDPPAELTPMNALERARSMHAMNYMMGEVLTSGQQITLKIDTHDARDGHLIASDITPLRDPGDIAAESNMISMGIARDLGIEPNTSPSPADVGTKDVEAYRYYSAGVEKVAQFQNLQAITLLKKAIELDPHFAMAYARIGYAYAVMDFQPESANRFLQRAAQLSGSLPRLNHLYIDAWTAIAYADYNTAIGVLQQITEQYPDEIEAHCQLSRLLRGQERISEAAALLKNAIHRNPDAKDLYNAYGLILLAGGRPIEGLEAYKQYVALDSSNPNSHDSLGMAYQQVGQYDSALAEYNEALKLDPDFEPSIVHLGDSYYQQGQYQEAVREYHRYIHVAGYSNARALGYGDLAAVYRAMNRLPEAQTAAAQELRNDDKAIWTSLVFAMTEHRSDRAAALEKRLLANTPNPERGSPPNLRMVFFYRGYIELKTGDQQAAIEHFKSALTHLPPSSGIDSHEDCLANAYLEIGMFQEAIAEYQRILQLNPHYPLAYFHMAAAYRGLHDQRDSKDAFRHFLQMSKAADQDSPPILEAKQAVQAPA